MEHYYHKDDLAKFPEIGKERPTFGTSFWRGIRLYSPKARLPNVKRR